MSELAHIGRQRQTQRVLRRLAWLGLVALPLLTATGCGEPNASVIIDNAGNGSPLSVAIDERPAGSIPAGDFKVYALPPGEHSFSIVSNGRTLFNGKKHLDTARSWGWGREYVFNPLGNQRYAVCKVVYGSSLFSEHTDDAVVKLAEYYRGEKVDPTLVEYVKIKKYAEPMPPAVWFELPSGVQFVLRQPPESMYSRYGSETRRALTRIPAKDHATLRRAHTIEKPTQEDLFALGNVTERALNSLDTLPPSSQ
jgi:hypothetical protein